MPFRYACFVSYRHGQAELTERIIGDLERALQGELELWLNERVFIDRARLQGGDFFNEALADALCQSVCMVVVYTPRYFDVEHPYCAREYKAMEQLEQGRLAALHGATRKTNGLIIPIVFRGKDLLPPELSDERQYYDFSNFGLHDIELSRNPRYAAEIQKIARYIYDRTLSLRQLQNDPCVGCNEFTFPVEADIVVWLRSIASTPPFPRA